MIQFRGLHRALRPYAEEAVRLAQQYGLNPIITSVYRDVEFQTRLYNNYQKCKAQGLFPSSVSLEPGMSCSWPANPPGDSAHNYGFAWDSWVPEGADRDLWIQIREYVGWRVPPNDNIHAELPEWRSYLT